MRFRSVNVAAMIDGLASDVMPDRHQHKRDQLKRDDQTAPQLHALPERHAALNQLGPGRSFRESGGLTHEAGNLHAAATDDGAADDAGKNSRAPTNTERDTGMGVAHGSEPAGKAPEQIKAGDDRQRAKAAH